MGTYLSKRWGTTLGPVTLGVTIVLTGCATLRGIQARDTESLLAAAGFQMQVATTSDQQQRLEAVEPYRLASRPKDGTVEYTYADPKKCKCAYVGGPKEYTEYQRLATERQIAQDRAAWSDYWAWPGPWWW